MTDCHKRIKVQILHWASTDIQWGRGFLLLLGGVGSPGSLLGLFWYHPNEDGEGILITSRWRRGGSLLMTWQEKGGGRIFNWSSQLFLLWHHPISECFGASSCAPTWWEQKSWLSTWPFSGRGEGEAAVLFSMVLSRVGRLLFKHFLSYEATLFLVLWLKDRLFLCLFLFTPIGVSGLLTSPLSILGYIRKKKNPGNSLLCIIPWAP